MKKAVEYPVFFYLEGCYQEAFEIIKARAGGLLLGEEVHSSYRIFLNTLKQIVMPDFFRSIDKKLFNTYLIFGRVGCKI